MFVGSGSSHTVNDEWMNEWINSFIQSSVDHVFMFSLHSVKCVNMLSFQFASKCHVILDMARTHKHFLLQWSITVKFERSALYGPTKVAYILPSSNTTKLLICWKWIHYANHSPFCASAKIATKTRSKREMKHNAELSINESSKCMTPCKAWRINPDITNPAVSVFASYLLYGPFTAQRPRPICNQQFQTAQNEGKHSLFFLPHWVVVLLWNGFLHAVGNGTHLLQRWLHNGQFITI